MLRFRGYDNDSLIHTLKSKVQQLSTQRKLLQAYQDQLPLADPITAARLSITIANLETQIQTLEDDLSPLREVLRWRAYEICTRRQELLAEVAGYRNQRQDYLKQGRESPNWLERKISEGDQKTKALQRQMDDAAAVLDGF